MEEEQLSREQLLLEIKKLRWELEEVRREKADLEILLETTTSHADTVAALLHESNQQLQAEIAERVRTEVALKTTQAELQSLLTRVSSDKADLEIILETTMAHADLVEDILHNECIRDPLTGLFNRRYLREFLVRELDHAQLHHLPLGLIMIDIDHFKRVNDTFGHDAGDLVLQEVSRLLQQSLHHSDIGCRYGGEELVVILPDTSLLETRKRAEQLRQEVKQLKINYLNEAVSGLAISLGIACFPEHGQTEIELIKAADAALYQAKALGRDRVVVAGLI